MDGLEEFEELFGLDITNDYLTESFNSGPITFENLFEETDLRKFDSIVPDDISSFLETEITEVEEDIKVTEDVFNINLENVYDNNNNKSKSEDINAKFSLWDNLDLGIEGACQMKEELMETSETDMANNFSVSPLFLKCNVNEVLKIDPMSKIGQKETKENNEENMIKRDQTHHNEVNITKKLKAKYSILPIVTHERAEEKNRKHKKGNQSPTRKSHIRDSKSFHFCNLCPFKTKEKSIIRMHQSFVHKMDATESEKKTTSQKPETIGRSSRPNPPKSYRSNEPQTIAIKKLAPMINNSNKKCSTFVNPAIKSFILPTIQNGFQGSGNDNEFPVPATPQHTLGEVKVETGGSQLFTLTPTSEVFLPSGVVNVVNCQVINPAPKKPVSILPKQPDYLINRFHQKTENISQKSNLRLLRNNQERQRRNETKSALDIVKVMVPKLRYVEKPSKINILNETMEYVKILQKTEKADLEEWEAQKKKFIKLKSRYKSCLQ